MNALIFDTHEFVKVLSDAGLPVPVAEALASEQTKILDRQDREVITRADLETLKVWVRSELQALEYRFDLRLQAAIAEIEKRIDERIQALDHKTDARFREQEAKTDQRFKGFDDRIEKRFQALEARLDFLEQKLDRHIAETAQEFAFIRQKLSDNETQMARLEHRLTMRLGGLMVSTILIVVAVISLV